MSAQLEALASRRRELVARCESDRDGVAVAFGAIERRLGVAEAVVTTVQRVHRHRALIGAAAAWMLLSPFSARKWIQRATWVAPLAVQGYRLARSLAEKRRSE